ncbi:MAG: hypothetical protein SFW62_04190 [Alphaproteobacteria bacterium]|nr:hypothetical protein [Alphaproteobacteria bacterium]
MPHDIKPASSPRPTITAEPLSDLRLVEMNVDAALQLHIDPEMARSIGRAVSDLLAQLPQIEGDDYLDAPVGMPENLTTETLPALLTTLPAVSDSADVRWAKIKQLPGYRSRPIRNLGEEVFMSFPCFRAYAESAQSHHRDAQGEVLVISDFTHGRDVTERVAKFIAEKGVFFEAGELNHPLLSGYHPRIAVFMTETWTFKLVQDSIENGTPVNANYIYAWPGGAKFYRAQMSIALEPQVPEVGGTLVRNGQKRLEGPGG